MRLSSTTALPLVSTLLTLTTAQQGTDANGCATFEPTAAFQLFDSFPDLTVDVTLPSLDSPLNTTSSNSTRRVSSRRKPNSHPKPRRSAHIPFTFYVSQDAGNTNQQDLVVAFSGLPCGSPGPFSFEFNFQPGAAYFAQGQGQINMFRVNTNSLGTSPTWNSIGPLTGSLVGTFELPAAGGDQPALLFLNELVCQDQLVLRFGITQYSSEAGVVAYINADGLGLRERNGC